MENLENTLRIITDNFEKGYYSTTLLGWCPNYDSLGRPLNVDPNYKTGRTFIEGKEYTYIRHRWDVYVYDVPTRYTEIMSKDNNCILHIDLTPEYLKNDTQE